MKTKTAKRCVTSLLTMGITACVSLAGIPVAHEGKSAVVICVAESVMNSPGEQIRWDKQTQMQRGRQNLQAAVLDLQTYLQRITGATIPVLTRLPQPGDKLPILIGEYASEKFGPPAEESSHGQAWRLVVSKQGVGMIGETEEAVAYAIYEFLHRVGCRWFMPGALGEVVPHMETLVVAELDLSGVPSTIARNISGINLMDGDACDYFRRNRLGGNWLAGAHALNTYISKEQLAEHPDWIAEWDGKREMMRTTRNCWGNPEVAIAIADEIIRRLDKHYVSSVSLAPSDGMVFCQCDKCTALDAGDWAATEGRVSITDRLIHFSNRIIARVTKKYPDVLFGTLAYVHYTQPPVREVPHPNLVVSLAPITYCRNHSMQNPNCPTKRSLYEIMQGWAKVTKNIHLYQYAFNLAEVTAPTPMISKWSEDLTMFYDTFNGGDIRWSPEAACSFEAVMPGVNLGVRLAFDSSVPPDEILTDFFNTCYGAAAPPMREYWETLDTAWGSTDEHTGCGFGYHLRFPPDVIAKARRALDQALSLSTGEAVRQRLRMTDESFREFELFMKMRRNFLAGDFKGLNQMSLEWMETWTRLNKTYAANYAFSKYGLTYFKSFFYPAYKAADELAATHNMETTSPMRTWKYEAVAEEDSDPEPDWAQPGYDDAQWKTTDICQETWSGMGLHDHFGSVRYRIEVELPVVQKGKRVALWVSSTDGSCRVMVNGKAVPYVDGDGTSAPFFTGYCQPASFDITAFITSGAKNLIAVTCERTTLNEIGTGGLMGPVIVYQTR